MVMKVRTDMDDPIVVELLRDMWHFARHFWKAILLIFVGMFLLSYFFAYMEAKTYTKITGREVSAWDAMWVKLRVEQ